MYLDMFDYFCLHVLDPHGGTTRILDWLEFTTNSLGMFGTFTKYVHRCVIALPCSSKSFGNIPAVVIDAR